MQKISNYLAKRKYKTQAQQILNEIWDRGDGLTIREIQDFLFNGFDIRATRLHRLMLGEEEATELEMIYIKQLERLPKKKEPDYWREYPGSCELTDYANKHGV